MPDRITPKKLTKERLREVLGGGVLIFGIPQQPESSPKPSAEPIPPIGEMSEGEKADTEWNLRRLEGYRTYMQRLRSRASKGKAPEASPSQAGTEPPPDACSKASPGTPEST